MARYEIIDEPHAKPWGERLILDPAIILFAAIIIPLFLPLPLYGRFWIPMLWLVLNGYALGSSTFGKEIATLVVGAVVWLALLYGVSYLSATESLDLPSEAIGRYMRILLFGVYFLTLYVVVFRQSRSYELYKYIRGENR